MPSLTQTWLEFKDNIKGQLFPPLSTGAVSAVPKSLVTTINSYFQEGATDLQSNVPELQVNNVEIVPFGSTFFECGKTMIQQPAGRIVRVFTIIDVKGESEHNWCSRVWLAGTTYPELEGWAKNYLLMNPPASVGSVYQNGLRHADISTDSTCGRARSGFYAIDRRWLYITPWIQSNEKVVILWGGVKDRWADTDVLELDWWGTQVSEAIKYFVKWKHELFFGCKEHAPIWEREYNNKRADIMHDYAMRSRVPWDDEDLNRLATSTELDEEAETVEVVEAVASAVVDLGGGQATITWVAPSVTFTPADARYKIERNGIEIADVAGTILTYVDTTVVGGETYEYKVFLEY